jgi:hypothetical protein
MEICERLADETEGLNTIDEIFSHGASATTLRMGDIVASGLQELCACTIQAACNRVGLTWGVKEWNWLANTRNLAQTRAKLLAITTTTYPAAMQGFGIMIRLGHCYEVIIKFPDNRPVLEYVTKELSQLATAVPISDSPQTVIIPVMDWRLKGPAAKIFNDIKKFMKLKCNVEHADLASKIDAAAVAVGELSGIQLPSREADCALSSVDRIVMFCHHLITIKQQ